MANARPIHIIFLDIARIILRLLKKLVQGVSDDRSASLLIFSNLIIIVLAVVQRWQLIELLWVYWLQNIIIGFFNWRRMMNLKEFSTENLKSDGRQPPPTRKTKRSMVHFFLLHYGFFHAAYLFFLIQFIGDIPNQAMLHGTIGLTIFFFNHSFSYRYNRELDDASLPCIGNIMFLPYFRIIPMHLVIWFAATMGIRSLWSLVFFLLLKTTADVLMHLIEHAINRKLVEKAVASY